MPAQTGMSFLQTLMRDLPDEGAVSFVLQRIASAVQGGAIVFDEAGVVIDTVGEAPAYLFWSEVSPEPERERAFHVGRWTARSRRVTTTSQPIVIVIASRNEEVMAAMGALYLDAAEIALLAVYSHVRGADLRQRRDREQLMMTLEEGILASREHRYWPRLKEFGFVPYAPLLLVVSERVTRQPLEAGAIAEAIDDAGSRQIPVLILTRIPSAESDAIAHLLLPFTERATAFARRRTTHSFAGASAPFTSLLDLPNAVREAELAYGVAVSHGLARRDAGIDEVGSAWVDFSRMRLTTWLMARAEAMGARARVRAILAPLDAHPDLRSTVITYLAHNQNVNKTATALFVHPNTVRYRLGNVAALLGDDIASPRVIASLYLCLEAEIAAATPVTEG